MSRNAVVALTCAALFGWSVVASSAQTAPRKAKVLIISLFAPEAAPWIKNLALDQKIRVAGLSPDFPDVACNADDVCLMTTGMGHTNAAASTMALLFSKQLDLSKSYILVGGIAGIDPGMGTLGTPAWARYLVDFGLQQEIDAREKPAGWATGYVGIQAADPNAKPAFDYRTEVFQLDEQLLQKALKLSSGATLADNDKAARTVRTIRPLRRTNPRKSPSAIRLRAIRGGMER